MRRALNDTVIELRSPEEIRSSSLFDYADLIMSVRPQKEWTEPQSKLPRYTAVMGQYTNFPGFWHHRDV
jgi:hypothetical protein